MAEPVDSPKDTAAPPKDTAPVVDESKLKAAVRDVLTELGVVKPKESGGGGGADIQSQVEAAVAKVKEREGKDAAERARDERLAALEAKTKTPEAIPKIVRRATRLMGWDRDGEE